MTDLTKLNDAEILELIEPMMDRMLEGSARIDHAMHVQDFTDRLKSIVTEERLGEMVLQAAFVWPDGKLLMDHAMFF